MEIKRILNKIVEWLKENRLVALYPVLAILIESTAVFVVEGTPFLTRPFLSLGLLAFICGILLLLPNDKVKLIVVTVTLITQAVLDLIFAVIFDMTDLYFSFEMFNLRNDAVAVLESIPLDFVTFYAGILFCSLYVVFGLRYLATKKEKAKKGKRSWLYYCGLSVVGLAVTVSSFFGYYPSAANKYNLMIEGKADSAYASYGMMGNFLGEIGNAIRGDDSTLSDLEMESFMYAKEAEKSPYFGISKDKNVVVMLCESLEWFAFRNLEKAPNALGLTDEQLATLYPNLTRFYNESVVMSSYHSKEKTDISETISVLGSYPTQQYICYDYYDKDMPQTLPNVLRTTQKTEMQIRSFHNGDKEFYNRDEVHTSFGFDSYTAREDMRELDGAKGENPLFTDYKEIQDEYNLDSEMIQVCKDEMFPTDKRFFTYITTITMHGVYANRKNLASALEAVEAVYGEQPDEKENPDLYHLFNYMVTAKDFDTCIGYMMEDLENKNLLDDTVIMLFSDHEAYYDDLSRKVKDIEDYETERKFSDLYNLPLMIYDADLVKKIDETKPEDRVIEKYLCTADLMPTLMDLLGIRFYSNMYYGHSAFVEEQSVMYSRAYNFFMTDGLVGRTVKGILYEHESVTPEQKQAYVEEASLLVEKIKHCDYRFKQDYFARAEKRAMWEEKLKSINE